MYTQCPQCKALFRIRDEQLQVAAGEVRCGRCNAAFNAFDYLRHQLPGDMVPPPHAPREDEVTEIAAPLPQPDDAPVANFEIVTPTQPEPAVNAEGRPGGDAFEEQTVPPLRLVVQDPATLTQAHEEETREELEAPAVHPDQLALISEGAVQDNDTDTPAADSYDVTRLYPELARSADGGPRARTWPGTIAWSMGIMFLLALFMLQLAYFSGDALAQRPALRPWLERFCEIAACEITPRREVAAIRLASREVFSHPQVRGGLLVKATLVNHAAFAQPFPQMQLTFFDLRGRVIARRRFEPGEYLAADLRAEAGMPPDSPVQVTLEIVDPGRSAVSYEFDFF